MALRYVRDGKRVLRIWADGICINQGDVHDRNMQVAFMGAIYSIARHTVIFLGEEKMEHESVLRRIAAFGAIPESNFDQDSLAKLVRDILVHPWFQRVWILQELVLSIDPWVQIGRTRMRWDVFVHCMMKYDATSRSSTQSHLETMSQIRAKYQTGKHSSANSFRGVEIFDILEARRGLGATDPKDMVYAHLGMSEPDVRSEINIDYSRSVAQIYEDISRYIYKLRQNISLLSHIEDLSSDARREGLPSWVPDWAIAWIPDQELETILEMENGESHMNLFHGVPGVLGIEGNYHGTVMNILPRECFRKSSMEEILEWLSGIESLGFMQRIFASAIQLSKAHTYIHYRALGQRSSYFQSVLSHLPEPARYAFESETADFKTRTLLLMCLIDEICNEDVSGSGRKFCFIKSDKDLGLCCLPSSTLKDDIIATFSTYPNIFVLRPKAHETEPNYCEALRDAFVREQHARTTDTYSMDDLEVKPCKLVSFRERGSKSATSGCLPQASSFMAPGANLKNDVQTLLKTDCYMLGSKAILAVH